jgi:methylenetetrahydrofolate dehydrogenase (NADP+)/methenyltetrahydrofolate cyclohydrolase
MAKELNGRELAEFIKERQAKQVRALKQADGIDPRLAIIRTNPDPIVDSYMRIKQNYGEEIGVAVDVHTIDQAEALTVIDKLNNDVNVQGIIVQIPLPDPSQTDEILNSVTATKDVDGLAETTLFDAPTPMAISWLLAGYNVELAKGKQVVIVGHGRLVGKPLAKMWKNTDYNVLVVDKKTEGLADKIAQADVIVSATGVPGLITAEMVKPDAVIVDAGVATDSNGLIGDVAAEVREFPDITITPEKGGVGPLTVAALFDNVIRACKQ